MPETFYTENCLGYHGVLQDLKIDKLGDGETFLNPLTRSYHLPGHSPDCLAVLLDQEAIIVGDIVLPNISPWPTRESLFEEVSDVIQPYYVKAEAIFGLRRYIKSLKKLAEIAQKHVDLFVLPGHRFYYNNQWNKINLTDRVDELLEHHVERCAAILEILRTEPKTAEEIAQEHFEERLLEGFGHLMAANEIISHCELLIAAGDVVAVNGDKFAITGCTNFETVIDNLRPDY